MEPRCPDCKASLAGSFQVARAGDPALFVETYACGAVGVYSTVPPKRPAWAGNVIRRCQTPLPPSPT